MVTIWDESMSRKSFKSWSLMSDAVMLRKLAAQKMPPIWKVRLFLNAKAVGAMASFTESPLFTRSFQSRWNLLAPSMLNISCMSFSRWAPFRGFACTPSRWKLFIRSFWMWSRRGLTCAMLSPSTPKVMNLVLVRPLLPLASCWRSIWEYSARTSSKPSFWNGMRMLFSNSVLSVAMFTKDNSNLMLESKKFRKLHHSSKIAVLSSCWASW